MSINVSHFVLESLGNAYYEVVDQRFDGAESRHILPGAMVDFDGERVLVRLGKANRKML